MVGYASPFLARGVTGRSPDTPRQPPSNENFYRGTTFSQLQRVEARLVALLRTHSSDNNGPDPPHSSIGRELDLEERGHLELGLDEEVLEIPIDQREIPIRSNTKSAAKITSAS